MANAAAATGKPHRLDPSSPALGLARHPPPLVAFLPYRPFRARAAPSFPQAALAFQGLTMAAQRSAPRRLSNQPSKAKPTRDLSLAPAPYPSPPLTVSVPLPPCAPPASKPAVVPSQPPNSSSPAPRASSTRPTHRSSPVPPALSPRALHSGRGAPTGGEGEEVVAPPAQQAHTGSPKGEISAPSPQCQGCIPSVPGVHGVRSTASATTAPNQAAALSPRLPPVAGGGGVARQRSKRAREPQSLRARGSPLRPLSPQSAKG